MFLERALRDSWAFFSVNFVAFELIILPIIYPAKLLQFRLQEIFAPGDYPFLHYLSAAGVAVIAYSITLSALVHYVYALVRKRPLQVSGVWALSTRRLLPVSLLVSTLALMVGLGMALFILPGIFLLCRFAFAGYDLIINESSPLQALGNSWRDSARAFWLLVGGFMVTLFVIMVVQWGTDRLLLRLGWDVWWVEAFVSSMLVVGWGYYLVFTFYFFAMANIDVAAESAGPARLEAPAGQNFGELDIVQARRDLVNEDFRVDAGTIGAVVSVYRSVHRPALYEVEFFRNDVIVGIMAVRGGDLELIEAHEELPAGQLPASG